MRFWLAVQQRVGVQMGGFLVVTLSRTATSLQCGQDLELVKRSPLNTLAVVFLTQGQGLVNSLRLKLGNCALRPSSSLTMFMSLQLLREVSRSSTFVTSQRDL